ncbi:MAG TPA: hypothetical protein VNG32_00150 [Candidatus Dormibacteraeota bacterium]|nr:hypothetical protein [Candidatus Dormibacteraeota bacterium]
MSPTAERLEAYHPFSEAIVESVSEIAYQNAGLTWPEFVSRNNLPAVKTYTPKHAKPIQLIDIIPGEGYDGTIVYHESMGTSINESSIMHVAPLALALPTKRIISVGSPDRPGKGYGKIAANQLSHVWIGDLRPTVDPTLEYLAVQGLYEASHIGYSYGADKALAATIFSQNYDLGVPYDVTIEPASVKNRNLLRLAMDFASAEKYLAEYETASNSRAFDEAREISGGLIGYSLGLLRLSNLATAHALSYADFEKRARQALTTKPDMFLSLQWGSESELAADGLMKNISGRLESDFDSRVKSTRLVGQRHAMSEDIFFHAATILHGIEQAAAYSLSR